MQIIPGKHFFDAKKILKEIKDGPFIYDPDTYTPTKKWRGYNITLNHRGTVLLLEIRKGRKFLHTLEIPGDYDIF